MIEKMMPEGHQGRKYLWKISQGAQRGEKTLSRDALEVNYKDALAI